MAAGWRDWYSRVRHWFAGSAYTAPTVEAVTPSGPVSAWDISQGARVQNFSDATSAHDVSVGARVNVT